MRLYYFETHADGSSWNFIATLNVGIREMAVELDLNNLEVIELIRGDSRPQLIEKLRTSGDYNFLKYRIDGEQHGTFIHEIVIQNINGIQGIEKLQAENEKLRKKNIEALEVLEDASRTTIKISEAINILKSSRTSITIGGES